MVNREKRQAPATKYRPTIIFIVGPTASGKSELAMELARRINGEIICADSQTVRKYLDIGTAKPSVDDQNQIRHHLLDVIEPYDSFNVNQFKVLAREAVEDIQSRQKTPIIVGGTGLYINSLYFDYELEESKINNDFKQKLDQLSIIELQEIIRNKNFIMPENKENPRHLIGTILRGGKTNQNDTPLSGSLIYGLQPDDETLRVRIDSRVESMFSAGFVSEVQKLVEDFGRPIRRMDAIGYPIVMRYIDGDVNIDEAKQLFKTAHWQYTRRQKSWFKLNPNITWLNNDSSAIGIIIREVKSY